MTGKEFEAAVGKLKPDTSKEDDETGEGKMVVGNMRQFKKIAKDLRVLARSSPDQKLILVTGL